MSDIEIGTKDIFGKVWRKCEICGQILWCPHSHLTQYTYKCQGCGREVHTYDRPIRPGVKCRRCGGEFKFIEKKPVPGFWL